MDQTVTPKDVECRPGLAMGRGLLPGPTSGRPARSGPDLQGHGWRRHAGVLGGVWAMAVITVAALAASAQLTPVARAEVPDHLRDPRLRNELNAVFADYEIVRVDLFNDRAGQIAEAAGRIARRSRRIAESAPENLGPHFEAIAEAAGALGTMGNDLGRLRRQFGELSRGLVELLTTEPAFQRGRYLFLCPMAEGYGRWIQSSRDVENPYMGQSMPSCGRRIDWPQ